MHPININNLNDVAGHGAGGNIPQLKEMVIINSGQQVADMHDSHGEMLDFDNQFGIL